MSLLEFYPLGDRLVARPKEEKFNDELYRTIPALDSLAQASLKVGNKLTQAARDSVFFGMARGQEPKFRALQVEIAMLQRERLASVEPDLAYFNDAKRMSLKEAQELERDNDVWIAPSPEM